MKARSGGGRQQWGVGCGKMLFDKLAFMEERTPPLGHLKIFPKKFLALRSKTCTQHPGPSWAPGFSEQNRSLATALGGGGQYRQAHRGCKGMRRHSRSLSVRCRGGGGVGSHEAEQAEVTAGVGVRAVFERNKQNKEI